MNKTILLLFAVFVLFLASCISTPAESVNESRKEAETTQNVGSMEPDDGRAEPYLLKTNPADQSQASMGHDFVETPEGYYYPCRKRTQKGGVVLIYFCPRGRDSFRPLCSKPNCRHTDENCNAWVGWGFTGSGFGYFDGALYAVNWMPGKIDVIKMNLDGTDHQVAVTLDDTDLKNCDCEFKFHHGKLFVWCTASYDIPLEEQEDHLAVLDLSDGTQREPAADYIRTAGLPRPFSYCKDKAYAHGTENKAQTYESYNPYDEKLIELDAVTGEVRVVLPCSINGLYVTDSTLYYYEADLSPLGYEAENVNPGFREYDVESGTVKDCGLPVEDIHWVRYDEDYIYAMSFSRNNGKESTLYFFSRNYELIDRMELKNKMTIYEIVSDRIFFYDDVMGPITCCLDKSKIGSGELVLIPIKTVG